MIAIGLGAAWVGYTVGLYGYCLIRGYNVTFRDLFGTTWPSDYGGGIFAGGTTKPDTGTGDIGSDTFT